MKYPPLNLTRRLGLREMVPLCYFKDGNGVVHVILTSTAGKILWGMRISSQDVAKLQRMLPFILEDATPCEGMQLEQAKALVDQLLVTKSYVKKVQRASL